ncbi:MAG: LytTR family transcriptional regulator [Flavobacteriaceae bacterium]|nr:LytTR family transcriptional regulator [Flavobacteriaceae bacterium]
MSILHINDALEYTIALGCISFLVVLVFLFIIPIIFKNYFTDEKWNIGKNLFFTLNCFIAISFFCWLYSLLSKNQNIPTASVFHFIYYALAVGTFPLVLFYIIDEKISRKKRQKIVAKIKEEKSFISKPTPKNTTLVLSSKNKKEKLTIHLNELVYITSEGNYTCIYTKENDKLKESILRNTLTNISKDLELYSSLIRCHKSYIINTNHIIDIQGNARGYILKSSDIPFDIPVSRSFPKSLLKNLIGK